MKFVLGFLAGVGTAWAALAIWQHRAVPDGDWKSDAWNRLNPIDPEDERYDHRFSPPRPIVPSSELIPGEVDHDSRRNPVECYLGDAAYRKGRR